MNADLKKKWLKALRGAKYRQGTGGLRRGILEDDDAVSEDTSKDEFCCLGVLCDIHNPSGWKRSNDDLDELDGKVYFRYGLNQKAEIGILPRGLRQHCGLDRQEESNLIGMNDSGTSFRRIARYIEENL